MGLLDIFRKKEEKIVPDVQDADLSRIRGLIEGKKDRDPGFYESVRDIDLKVFPLDTNTELRSTGELLYIMEKALHASLAAGIDLGIIPLDFMNSSTYVNYLTGFSDGYTWDYLDEIADFPEEKKRKLINNKYNAYYYAYILGLTDTYPGTPERCDEKQLCSMLVQYGSHMKLLEACKAKVRSKEDVLTTADDLTLECMHYRYKKEQSIPYDPEMELCAYLQRQQAYYALKYE